MSKKLFLTLFVFASTFLLSNAQPSWQWGKRGGSSSTGSGSDETIVDLATDKHGNVYILSTVLQTGLSVDGHSPATWGGYDVLISSFKCDGTFRWSKNIGGSGDDYGMALKTDTLGGVYVAGFLATHFITVHFDADTSWSTGTSYKSYFVVKFDTAGAYKWLRMPQPDTAGLTAYSHTFPLDMDVDGAGNVHLFSLLSPGIYGGSYVTSGSIGVHILRYDRFGTFLGGIPMQISVTGVEPRMKMKRDHASGRYYVTGPLLFTGGTLTFGSTPITHAMYIGCFTSSGTFVWQHQDTDPILYASTFGRAAIDAQHYIYLAGKASSNDTFNSYIMTNAGSTAVPVVFKLDSNGNNIWAKNANVNGATFCNGVALSGSEVIVTGQYPGKLKWPGYSDSLNLSLGSGYHIYITRFNAATGSVVKMDSLASSSGTFTEATSIVSDGFGNAYVGGDFEVDLTVNATTLSSAGGGSDFFIAKYGTSNCNFSTLSEPTIAAARRPLNVYPNPATDELIIEHAANGADIRLLNIMVQAVYTGIASDDHIVVSTRTFTTGIYMLQITDPDGSKTSKTIVKQ